MPSGPGDLSFLRGFKILFTSPHALFKRHRCGFVELPQGRNFHVWIQFQSGWLKSELYLHHLLRWSHLLGVAPTVSLGFPLPGRLLPTVKLSRIVVQGSEKGDRSIWLGCRNEVGARLDMGMKGNTHPNIKHLQIAGECGIHNPLTFVKYTICWRLKCASDASPTTKDTVLFASDN